MTISKGSPPVWNETNKWSIANNDLNTSRILASVQRQ
jgi:hypothetical protein